MKKKSPPATLPSHGSIQDSGFRNTFSSDNSYNPSRRRSSQQNYLSYDVDSNSDFEDRYNSSRQHTKQQAYHSHNSGSDEEVDFIAMGASLSDDKVRPAPSGRLPPLSESGREPPTSKKKKKFLKKHLAKMNDGDSL